MNIPYWYYIGQLYCPCYYWHPFSGHPLGGASAKAPERGVGRRQTKAKPGDSEWARGAPTTSKDIAHIRNLGHIRWAYQNMISIAIMNTSACMPICTVYICMRIDMYISFNICNYTYTCMYIFLTHSCTHYI